MHLDEELCTYSFLYFDVKVFFDTQRFSKNIYNVAKITSKDLLRFLNKRIREETYTGRDIKKNNKKSFNNDKDVELDR